MNEIALIVCIGISGMFYDPNTLSKHGSEAVGRVYVYLVVIIIALNWVVIIKDSLFKMKKILKERKLKK